MMNEPMESRKAARYPVSDTGGLHPDLAGLSCDFDFDRKLKGMLVDVSLGGFGLEIRDITGTQVEDYKARDNYIITIYFGTDSMIADVKNVWNRVLFDQGRMVLKGGASIDIISTEDRLKLSGIIEKIRSSR
jgi:hypothetical protein